MKKILITGLLISCTLQVMAQSRAVTFLGQHTYNTGINDVWGYADTANNKEYALVGVNDGLSIVDVTNAATPTEVEFVSGPSSIWRDMKTWDHYAYTVHDFISQGTEQGLLIVDLSTINSPNPLVTKTMRPSITINGSAQTLDKAHNIYIDENGVLYVFGADVSSGGALMFDVATNPMNPKYLGAFDNYYFHDGVARGDTLYGAAINRGFLSVVDVSNKANMQILATTNTPNNFTHNVWFSDDNNTVYTTDERSGAYVTAYDISDLNNISELDRIQTRFGGNVIPHNTHFYNNFLVTSYYTSGLQIVDAHEPDMLVETAYFDSSPFSGDGFGGAWGAYPWLPSGNILVTDREQGLFILSSTYPRATYLEIFVKDSVTGKPIINAQLDFVNASLSGTTNLSGFYKDGQADTGTFRLVIRKGGFQPDTITVNMRAGQIFKDTIALLPNGFNLSENRVPSLAMFPNPNQGALQLHNIPLHMGTLHLEFRSISGTLISRKTIEGGREQAVTIRHHLPKGIYLVALKNKENQAVQRGKLMVK